MSAKVVPTRAAEVAPPRSVARGAHDGPTYRADIDGLRAVAVLLVVAFHAFPGVVRGGFVGVDVFFVISGFLISGIILDARADGSFSLREFYARRVRRIFPALAVVLLATFAIGWFVLSPAALAQLGRHTVSGSLFVPNFTFWSEVGYFDVAAEAKPLLHLWSLGIEEQFYVVWPLTLLVLTTWRRLLVPGIAALVAASFVASITLVESSPTAAFFAPWSRAWELLVGALVALGARHWGRGRGPPAVSTAGLGLIAVAAATLTPRSPFPGWAALLPVAGAALVLAGPTTAGVARVLAWRPLVAIGLVSYPLYLWHWPLLSFVAIDGGGDAGLGPRLGAVAAAVVLATVTYRWVERPVRRRRHMRWHVPALGGALLVCAAVGAVAVRSDGFSGRYARTLQDVLAYAEYDAIDDGRNALCWVGDSEPFDDFGPECFLAPGEGGVLLWGDSHAARLYPGLRRVLPASVAIGELARSSCMPVVGHEWEGLGAEVGEQCRESNDAALAAVDAADPPVVVLFAAWGVYADDWSAGSEVREQLEETLDEVSGAGAGSVVLVGPAPTWRPDLPSVIVGDWNSQPQPKHIPERLATGLDSVPATIDADLRAAAEGAGVAYVSLLDLLCDETGCLTSVPGSPGTLLAWDYGHLTTEGATLVAEHLVGAGVVP